MAGRIECYMHSDSIQLNKGGCLVEAICDTDFGANTKEFIDFAKWVAKMAYGFGSASWNDLVSNFPDAIGMKKQIETTIKEAVRIRTIQRITLADEWMLERERAGKK